MRALVIFALSSLLCASVSAEPLLLLTPARADALDAGERTVLDDAVRAEVLALGTVSVVGRDEQRAAIEAVPCDGTAACSIARGKRAGADAVLVTKLVGAADLTVRMTLFDVTASAERHRVEVSGARAQLREHTRAAVVRALAPERYIGRVDVVLAGVEAEVVIDGVPVGRTPMLAAVAVAPARHELEVRAPGLAPYRGFVDVAFDAVVAVPLVVENGALTLRAPADVPAPASPSAEPRAASMAPEPTSGSPLFTGGVVAAIGGGALLIAGVVVTAIAFDQKARFNRGLASVNEIRANQAMGPTGLVLLGAGVLGVGTAVALLAASATLEEPDDDAAEAQ